MVNNPSIKYYQNKERKSKEGLQKRLMKCLSSKEDMEIT